MPIDAPVAAIRQKTLAEARKKAAEAAKSFKESIKKGAKNASKAFIEARPTLLEVILFALPLALLADAIDLLELTIIGKVITIVTDAIIGLILSAWLWLRSGQSINRKLLKIIVTFVAEFIPVVGFLPLWTLMVINAKTGWFDPIFAIPEKVLSL